LPNHPGGRVEEKENTTRMDKRRKRKHTARKRKKRKAGLKVVLAKEKKTPPLKAHGRRKNCVGIPNSTGRQERGKEREGRPSFLSCRREKREKKRDCSSTRS